MPTGEKTMEVFTVQVMRLNGALPTCSVRVFKDGSDYLNGYANRIAKDIRTRGQTANVQFRAVSSCPGQRAVGCSPLSQEARGRDGQPRPRRR